MIFPARAPLQAKPTLIHALKYVIPSAPSTSSPRQARDRQDRLSARGIPVIPQLQQLHHGDSSLAKLARNDTIIVRKFSLQYVILSEAKDLVFRIGKPFSPNNGLLRRGAEGPERSRRAPQNDIHL
ncbi:MAG: hypothetical protein AMJ88_06090 [Anaerolineae bacterium SM23_ 63]|nr:MAG: hypothetical protein AMJ88_06090 [Anaerolineae bacterium SM23_ 63]